MFMKTLSNSATATAGFVLPILFFIRTWIKHYLFRIFLVLFELQEHLWPTAKVLCPRTRGFIRFIRFTEFIGVKPTITMDVLNELPESESHYDNILFLKKKLIHLFDDNLGTLYPSHAFVNSEDKVRITRKRLFKEESFHNEHSYFIETFNKSKEEFPKATVLYFHGGGFLVGTGTTYKNILTPWLYENNFDALIVDYKLCPDHTPEKMIEDARAAFFYLINERKISPKNIILAGESAGANIVLNMLIRYLKEGNREHLPAGMVLMSPWADLTLSTPSWKSSLDDMVLTDALCRVGEKLSVWKPDEDPRSYSPIFLDLSELPPAFVSWGESERLRDESLLLCDRMNQCGVSVERDPVKGMFHAFCLFHEYIPEARQSFIKAAEFIKQRVQ